jgi:hypothetical protein
MAFFFIGEAGERTAERKMGFFYPENWPLFVPVFFTKTAI